MGRKGNGVVYPFDCGDALPHDQAEVYFTDPSPYLSVRVTNDQVYAAKCAHPIL